MTSPPEPPPTSPETVVPQRLSGLAIAALAIGVAALVSAGAAWVLWLVAGSRSGSSFGWFAYTPLRYADYLPRSSNPDFAGPVWFAVLPIASVGLVFARAVRLPKTRVPGVRASTITGIAALVLAVGGLVLLVVQGHM